MPSPRLSKDASQTTKKPQSASMLLIVTALDTTWRAFLPTIGGTFLGIGIDKVFNVAPVGLIASLTIGTLLSILLIAKQLRDVRKNR